MSPSGASAAGDQIFIDRTATEVRNRSLGTVFNLLYVDNFSDVPRQSNGMLFDDSMVIFFFCTPLLYSLPSGSLISGKFL
jgi:hypothetical protein